MKYTLTFVLLILICSGLNAQELPDYKKEVMSGPLWEKFQQSDDLDTCLMLFEECMLAYDTANQKAAEQILFVQTEIACHFSRMQQLHFSDSLAAVCQKRFIDGGYDTLNYAYGNIYNAYSLNAVYIAPDQRYPLYERMAQIWQVVGDQKLNTHCLIELVNGMPVNRDTEKRLVLLDSAIRICKREGYDFYLAVALALKGQFVSYYDPVFAREILEESIAVLNAMPTPNYRFMLVAYSMMAGVYHDLGDEYIDQEIYWHLQQEKLFSEKGIFSPPRQLELYLNFFDTYLEIDDYANARRCVDSTGYIFNNYFDSTHIYFPFHLMRKAKLLTKEDSLDKARPYAQRALKLFEESGRFSSVLNARDVLAEIEWRSGNKDKAMDIVNYTLFASFGQEVPENPLDLPEITSIEEEMVTIVPPALENKILLMLELYDENPSQELLDALIAHYQLAVEYYERFMISALSMEESLISYSKILDKITNDALTAFADIEMDQKTCKGLWEVVSANKANQLLINRLKSKELERDSYADQKKHLMAGIQELQVKLEDLPNEESDEYAGLHDQWMEKHQELLILQMKSDENSPEASLHAKAMINAGDLLEKIPEGTAVLDYYLFDSVLYCFEAQNGRLSFRAEQLSQPLDQEIKKVFRSIKTGRKSEQILANLSAVLLNDQQFEGVSKLMVIPDKDLFLLPFELLPYDDQKMLIEDFSVVYNYSPVFYYEALQKEYRRPEELLLMAPGFDSEEGALLAQRSPFRGSDLADFDDIAFESDEGISLASLPYTLKEVTKIDKIARKKGLKTNLLTESEATEQAFMENAPEAGIIHIATHGIAIKSQPNKTGVFLNQDVGDEKDGFLKMSELFTMDLNASLVVLSACKTAYGDIAEGEGIMALPRGFLFAGAENILASLWKVHDKHSMELMLDFYEAYLSGDNYAEALRQAKLKAIKEGQQPLNWAGFILIGD